MSFNSLLRFADQLKDISTVDSFLMLAANIQGLAFRAADCIYDVAYKRLGAVKFHGHDYTAFLENSPPKAITATL